MFIRTNLNRNNLNTVVDISHNAGYVSTTAMEWIEIPEQPVHIGDYFVDGIIIHPEGEQYDTIVSPLIAVGEESYKVMNNLSAPTDEPLQNPYEETPQIEEETPGDVTASAPPVEVLVTEQGMPVPKPSPENIDEEPSNLENQRRWREVNGNLNALLSRLKANNGITIEGRKYTFNPPIEYPSGRQDSVIFNPHSNTAGWISFLEVNNANQTALLARMDVDLANINIP